MARTNRDSDSEAHIAARAGQDVVAAMIRSGNQRTFRGQPDPVANAMDNYRMGMIDSNRYYEYVAAVEAYRNACLIAIENEPASVARRTELTMRNNINRAHAIASAKMAETRDSRGNRILSAFQHLLRRKEEVHHTMDSSTQTRGGMAGLLNPRGEQV